MFTHSSPAPVRFGHCSGFAFDGDHVRLDADLVVTSPLEAGGCEWSLQLLAAPVSAAASAGELTLAELPCGTLMPDEHGRLSVSGTTIACLPAGHGAYALSLALASVTSGRTEVCDRVRFERNEAFSMPRLAGVVGYVLDGDIARVSVQRIENPRGSDNLSGTLALELWALPAPYQGGAFSGVRFGSVTLGTLAGQASWSDVALDLPRAELAPGQWQLVLMLREWTPAGYLTRDYCNFALPLNVAEVPVAVEAAPVEPTPDHAKPVQVASTAPAAARPETPAPVPAKGEKSENAAKAAKGTKPAASPKVAPAKASAAAPVAVKAASEVGVSLNSASEAELLALPGLTAKLVKGIIAGRPWAQVNDLIAVKGIGPKMLDKLRPLIRR